MAKVSQVVLDGFLEILSRTECAVCRRIVPRVVVHRDGRKWSATAEFHCHGQVECRALSQRVLEVPFREDLDYLTRPVFALQGYYRHRQHEPSVLLFDAKRKSQRRPIRQRVVTALLHWR